MSAKYVEGVVGLDLLPLALGILRALALVATEEGVVSVSLNEIVERCGYAPSSVYHGLRQLHASGVLVLERRAKKPQDARRYRIVLPATQTPVQGDGVEIVVEPWEPWDGRGGVA